MHVLLTACAEFTTGFVMSRYDFLASLPSDYTYNADGKVETITKTDGTDTWRRTFTWTNGKLTKTSGWVKV